jgi:sigma-54-specific transcriptional regulator
MVQAGQFRADLFHRLNVASIHIPPLRERPGDIRPLVEYFLEKHRGLQRMEPSSVDADFIEALSSVDLPGNARQLENMVRQTLINKNDDGPLGLADLSEDIWRALCDKNANHPESFASGAASNTSQPLLPDGAPNRFASYFEHLLESKGWNLERSLDACERSLVETALHVSNRNQSEAARLLGITARSVYNKVRKYGLRPSLPPS